jgi:hypothetical protein
MFLWKKLILSFGNCYERKYKSFRRSFILTHLLKYNCSFKLLADTYYQLGFAFTATSEFEGIHSFESVEAILQLRIASTKWTKHLTHYQLRVAFNLVNQNRLTSMRFSVLTSQLKNTGSSFIATNHFLELGCGSEHNTMLLMGFGHKFVHVPAPLQILFRSSNHDEWHLHVAFSLIIC